MIVEIKINYETSEGNREQVVFTIEDTRIDLSGRGISKVDLSPLSKHSKMLALDLSDNDLRDVNLSPLSSCTNMEQIRLDQNKRMEYLDLTPLVFSSHLSLIVVDDLTTATMDPLWKHLEGRNAKIFGNVTYPTYEEIVTDQGWPSFRDSRLSRLESVSEIDWFPVQRGLLCELGMRELSGFDGNPRSVLEPVTGNLSYEEARRAVYENVVGLLERQLKGGGSTLFLEVDVMKKTVASRLISLLVERREMEMEEVEILIHKDMMETTALWCTTHGARLIRGLGFRGPKKSTMKGRLVADTHISSRKEIERVFKNTNLPLRFRDAESYNDKPAGLERVSPSLIQYVESHVKAGTGVGMREMR
ncbi:MAG: hypothetical protein ACXABD_07140 [Candidatus Thorarchaeota archaeon]